MDRAVWISGEEKLLDTTEKLIFSGSSNVLNGCLIQTKSNDTSTERTAIKNILNDLTMI